MNVCKNKTPTKLWFGFINKTFNKENSDFAFRLCFTQFTALIMRETNVEYYIKTPNLKLHSFKKKIKIDITTKLDIIDNFSKNFIKYCKIVIIGELSKEIYLVKT